MTAAMLTRPAPAVLRARPKGSGFSGWAVRYGVIDSHGTAFARGWADLGHRTIAVTPSHDWAMPVGKVTAWRETDEGLYIERADMLPAGTSPTVDHYRAMLREGIIGGLSVGFLPGEVEHRRIGGRDDVLTFVGGAELVEVALVLEPSVPGSTVTEVRRRGGSTWGDIAAAEYLLARHRIDPTEPDPTVALHESLAALRARGLARR